MTTTLQIDLAEILEQKYPHGFHAPADIDISSFLEFADDDWSHDLDIDDLLADRWLIAIIWNVQLVLDERPDLTDDQAWTVLQGCQPHFEEATDPMRATIRQVAGELFPKPQGKEALRAVLARIERQIEALPESELTNPAEYGSVGAALDAIEAIVKGA
jgi:hypothetical protein